MKAHVFRELVNDLRDIATQWHGSEQLRERISGRLRKDVSIDEDPAADGWIPWAGGECPLADGVWHRVRFRDGYEPAPIENPLDWRWTATGLRSDIIAYRVVKR